MHRSWFVSAFLLVALTIPTLSRAYEWAPPGRIIRASYGAYGHFIDVTRIVRHYAFPDGRMDVSNETFGSDPFKGERKTLQVVFDTPDGGLKGTSTKGTPSVLEEDTGTKGSAGLNGSPRPEGRKTRWGENPVGRKTRRAEDVANR